MILWLLAAGCKDRDDTATVDVPGDLLVVVETASGRMLFVEQATGAYQGEVCLHELMPDDCFADPQDDDEQCLLFAVEHRMVDAVSQWLISFNARDSTVPYTPAQIALITPGHPPQTTWRIDGLSFAKNLPQQYGGVCAPEPDPERELCHLNGTHVAVLDGETLIVADTNNSRVLWLEAPTEGVGPAEVVAVLDGDHPDWEDWRSINNVQRLTEGDRELLLTTFKSAGSQDQLTDTGRIVLWDVTDLSAIERVWTYPEEGFLAAVHHGLVQETASGEQWLVYAHSLGASDDPDAGVLGSVGMARYNGTSPPEYLADGVLGGANGLLGFVREVEIPAPHDWLLVTDSGCENPQAECALQGRVVSLELPDLEPSGLSGSLGDQTFVKLPELEGAFVHEVVFPYEADVFDFDEVDETVRSGLGACE